MVQKRIEYDELITAIRIAFNGDDDIYKFYDPTATVKNLDDIVKDILRKLGEYEGIKSYGIYEAGDLIGYYVFKEEMLISFGINVAHRTPNELKRFFSIIKKKIGNEMFCLLFSRNTRAIRWLNKMGMPTEIEVKHNNIKITKLNSILCH